MTTLAANQQRTWQEGDNEAYPVIAADIIYQGAAVGENGSGYARPLAQGDPFLGFAIAKADNSSGAAGDINVDVRVRGRVKLTVAGATAITANDRPAVYASDDNTFTLTSTSNSLIGYVSRWISSTVCIVEFDALAVKAALQA
ncbi:MAG: cytoplasmic protein [Hyphomicrobiaceae bacterium]|nr:cytoplasmic protein [Hyphomicrobiaceae bacterium]